MDYIKSLTGKNPAEYQQAASRLVNTPDLAMFEKLVKQDDFLFDFVKNNVANRIKSAVNKENYRNILKFFKFYSPSYDSIFAEIIWHYGQLDIYEEMKEMFISGSLSEKSYAAKYFALVPEDILSDLLVKIREYAFSEDEFLSQNCIQLLSKLQDNISKERAISKLNSDDEFEAYDAVKFLVTFGAKECLKDIINVMKKSTLSENIASEIPFMISINELIKEDYESGILVLCNIINAIPEIIPPSTVIDYNIYEILENLYYENLNSFSALLLRMSIEKFASLTENEEYLFDCDKNTKDEIKNINNFLSEINKRKLDSLLYEELYEESDFVLFAIDYVENIEEIETLLDSTNQTLVLKVLSLLKEKNALTTSHKELALKNINTPELKQIVEIL